MQCVSIDTYLSISRYINKGRHMGCFHSSCRVFAAVIINCSDATFRCIRVLLLCSLTATTKTSLLSVRAPPQVPRYDKYKYLMGKETISENILFVSCDALKRIGGEKPFGTKVCRVRLGSRRVQSLRTLKQHH